MGGLVVVARLVPVRFGEVELWVEAVPVAGSEPTSGLDRAGERVVDAFGQVQAAIVEVASSTAKVVSTLAKRGRRPDRLEVELGLSFTVKGNVIVAGADAGATLKVKVVYDAPPAGAGVTG